MFLNYNIVCKKISLFIKNINERKNCIIDYTDNGRGFDMKKVRKGVGFESIQTRVDSYNGKLKMHASKGKGVNVLVGIPFLPAASLEKEPGRVKT